MSRAYSSARLSRRPVARVGQSRLLGCFLRQECLLGAPIWQDRFTSRFSWRVGCVWPPVARACVF
ncbi:hypothetical protein FIBSPDRAFT_872444, partial [Athelia psychrophila]